MGSLLQTSVLMGFMLLLPALVYCDRSVSLDLFTNTNCTQVPTGDFAIPFYTFNSLGGNNPNTTFSAGPNGNYTQTFSSAILTNLTGEVSSLVACQIGLECNATGAIQISFNLSDIGACSTAGPPGTVFDKFMMS